MNQFFNTENYPTKIHSGTNHDIYTNGKYCAAIPNEHGESIGCLASSFGSIEYATQYLSNIEKEQLAGFINDTATEIQKY
jgi:hypothetical protein